MTAFGKSIRLYLKDGSVTGIKFGEVVNNTIQSISCPRVRINELAGYAESKRPGVYFLFGIDEESGEPKVYVGEAENVYDRVQHHIAGKDFWTEIIFFVSKDENLTKSHVKYLESRLIQIARSTKRYVLDNTNQSQLASLPLADKDAMEEFLSFLRLLLGVLGHKLLEELTVPVTKKDDSIAITRELPISYGKGDNTELYLNVSDIKAKALQTDEGIVVLKGSEATLTHTDRLSFGYKELREKLTNNKSLRASSNKYMFEEDVLFASPSQAAAVIVGYNINGRATWKDGSGKSLKEIEKQELNHQEINS